MQSSDHCAPIVDVLCAPRGLFIESSPANRLVSVYYPRAACRLQAVWWIMLLGVSGFIYVIKVRVG